MFANKFRIGGVSETRSRISLLAGLIAFSIFINHGGAQTPNARAKGEAGKNERIEACDLITNEQASAIQQAKITDRKSSETSDGSFLTTQCYLASEESDKSISITIIQRDPAQKSPRSVNDYWHQAFARFEKPKDADEVEKKDEKDVSADRRKSEENEGVRATQVEGVGDQAYWSGTKIGGVLYVLKKELILRISVGGPDKEETKISKSKALAQKAIERLPD